MPGADDRSAVHAHLPHHHLGGRGQTTPTAESIPHRNAEGESRLLPKMPGADTRSAFHAHSPHHHPGGVDHVDQVPNEVAAGSQEGGERTTEMTSSSPAASPGVGSSQATQHLQAWANAQEAAMEDDQVDWFTVCVLVAPELVPVTVNVKGPAAVGTLCNAEAKLCSLQQPIRISTLMGQQIDPTEGLKPGQILVLEEVGTYQQRMAQQDGASAHLTNGPACRRTALLNQQQGWVADDEYDYYLHQITTTHAVNMVEACVLPLGGSEDDVTTCLIQWFQQCHGVAQQGKPIVTALLAEYHWFPVVWFPRGIGLCIKTTPEGKAWIDAAQLQAQFQCQTYVASIGSSFDFDCGFQAIAWTTAQLGCPSIHDEPAFVPITSAEASVRRSGFHLHVASQKGKLDINPADFRFGGGKQVDITDQLAELLVDHGVPNSHAVQRAEQTIDKLGRTDVAKALRHSAPWRALKQLANQPNPRVQLVLEQELAEVIQARVTDQKPFGRKKQRAPTQRSQPLPQLQPADVEIPAGIFASQDGTPVNQLHSNNIGVEAQGIVVMTAAQAVSYMRFPQPVSRKSLALLVLDHSSPLVHGLGEAQPVPAKCIRTSEPIITRALLIQIGQVPVVRCQATDIPKIHEVDNAVVRALVFRDEWHGDWGEFTQQPVRTIVQQNSLLQASGDSQSPIMDCWDRQYLTLKMEKSKPRDSQQFVVTFRLQGCDIKELMSTSGTGPFYFEPRDQSGRTPHAQWRVIWLNKQDKPAANIARQAIPMHGAAW